MKTIKNTHIGSYGFIIKDDSIALIKKARGGYKGLLDLPGGGIEHNETPIEALKRELKEEAGVEVINQELLTVTSRIFEWNYDIDIIEDLQHIGILYKVEVKNYNLKEESDGIDSNGCFFYKINELSSNEVTPFVKDGLEILGYELKNN